MNKKYVKYSILPMLLMICKPSFSMPELIFRGGQLIGNGYSIAKGLNKAYEFKNANAGPMIGTPVPARVEEWFRKELKSLNLHRESESMPILCRLESELGSWEMEGDRCIRVSVYDITLLNEALEFRENKKNESLLVCDDDSEMANYEQIIALNTAWLKHEMGHYIHKDSKCLMYQQLWVPLAVQSVCSTVTYGFNSLYKIKAPNTMPWAMVRSTLAIATILPKTVIIQLGHQILYRSVEKKADQFACENAATRLELEVWHRFFRNSARDFEESILGHSDPQSTKDKLYVRFQHASYDMWHPYFADRASMIQVYLDKWDAEHPVDEHTI